MRKWCGFFKSVGQDRALPLLSAILAVIYLAGSIHTPAGDGSVRAHTFATLFVDGGRKAILSKYSTIQPLLAKCTETLLGVLTPFNIPKESIPPIMEALVLIIFIGFMLQRYKYSIQSLLVVALLPLSMIPHYLGQFYSEITTSTLMAIGFLMFSTLPGQAWMVMGAFTAAIGVSNSYILLVPLGVVTFFSLFRVWRGQGSEAHLSLFLILTLLLSCFLVSVEMLLKTSLVGAGYFSSSEAGFRTILPFSGKPGFSYPLILGIFSSLFSAGKSVFLFNPFLIFIITQRYQYKAQLVLFFVATLIVYSQWWAWYGGLSFGTRFYMFAIIPSITIFAISLCRKSSKTAWAYFLTVIGGIWLAICSKYFGLEGSAEICSANNYSLEAFCWYVPEFSPLAYPMIHYSWKEILTRINMLDWLYIGTVTLVAIRFIWPHGSILTTHIYGRLRPRRDNILRSSDSNRLTDS